MMQFFYIISEQPSKTVGKRLQCDISAHKNDEAVQFEVALNMLNVHFKY